MTFSENDIRPAVFTSDKEAALQRDLARLRAQKAGFIEVGCPACDSRTAQFAFEKYAFQFVRCEDCQTVYMNPRATPEILQDFYAHSELYAYWNKFIFPASREVRREKIFKPRVQRILEICDRCGIATGTLLEAGAGFGIFCEEIAKTGRFGRVIAVEPGAALAASCRALGLEVIEDTIENVRDTSIQASVIACFEVIEHLFSPQDFLQNCQRLLAPHGLVVVTCPNFKGFDIETLAPESDSLDAEHVNLFNPDSLARLMQRCGFEVVECTTPGELDAEIVRNRVLGGAYSLAGQPFLQTVLIDRWADLGKPFQEFLKQQRLSSHLWLVARKVD